MLEINKSVSDIALVLEVNRQIHKIVASYEAGIYRFQQHLLRVLIRYITNHNCGSLIDSFKDILYVNSEPRFVLIRRVSLSYPRIFANVPYI